MRVRPSVPRTTSNVPLRVRWLLLCGCCSACHWLPCPTGLGQAASAALCPWSEDMWNRERLGHRGVGPFAFLSGSFWLTSFGALHRRPLGSPVWDSFGVRLNVQSGQRKCPPSNGVFGTCGRVNLGSPWFLLVVGVSVAPLGGGPLKRWLGTPNLWGAAPAWVLHAGFLPIFPVVP